MNRKIHIPSFIFILLLLLSGVSKGNRIFYLPPSVSLSPLSDVCENTSPFKLTGGSPVGGIYNGTGVTGNTFYPAQAGAGTYTITYTVYSGGTPYSAATTIKVNPLPKPHVSGNLTSCQDTAGKGQYHGYTCVFSNGNGSFGGPAGGSNTVITACENSNETYSTKNSPGNSYSWIISGGTISSGQNSSTVNVTWGVPGSGSIAVVETNSGGCSDTAGVCFIINPKPKADFSAGNTCLGIANQFNDLSNRAVSWYWDFGDGATSTDRNPNHTYAAGGTYTVKLIVNNLCGCPDIITKTVTVNSSPGPKIICPSTVCPGQSSPYTTDANCSNYNWSVTGGTITSGQNTNHILVDWGAGPAGTISLSTSGCTPANCTNPTTVTIPILSSSLVISGPASACQYTTNKYSLPVFPGGVYSWSIVPATAGTISSGQGTNQVSIIWQVANSNVQIVATVGNPFIGCKSTATLTTKILAQFYVGGTSQVCKGSNSTITANPAGSYNWTVPGGTIVSGQGSSSLSVNWPAAGTYTVTATPSSPGTYCNASSTSVITVTDVPSVDSISGPIYICPGTSSVYTAWSSTGNVTYSWTAANGTLSSATGNPVSVTWGASGPYSVSVTQKLNYPACQSPPVTINVKDIQVTPPQVIGPATACVNGTYAYSLPYYPGVIYTWSISPANAGSVISGQGTNTAQVLYNSSGTATINVSIGLCSTPANTSFSVLVNPAPSPTIISGSFCSGSNVTLSSGGAFSSYTWQNSSLSTIGTASTVNVSTEGSYVLIVTDSKGCIGKTIANVTADPDPNASISTPDKKDYCTGDVISTALHAMVGTGYTYQWYYNGSTAGTGNSLTATTTGSYYVVVTNSSGCVKTSSVITITQGPCGGGPLPCIPLPLCGMPPCTPPPPSCIRKDTAGIDFKGNGILWIEKNNDPVLGKNIKQNDVVQSVNSNGAINPLSIQVFCTNLINFTNNSTVASTAWYWDFGDGSTSALQNPSHTYAQAGYYYVTFWEQFSNTLYGKTNKSIEIPAVGDFNYKVNCGTAAFNDLSTHTSGSAITAWSWDFGDASTSSSQNPSHSYAAPGTYNVTLTVTAGGCTSTINKSVVVQPFPTAQFSSSASCAGSPVQFTDASTGTNIVFWNWDFGDGSSSSLQNPTHTYTASGTYNVTLKVTDVNGCTGTKVQTVSVTAPSGGGAITASGPTTLCTNQSVSLTAPAATSYLWSTGSTLQSITVNQSGIYSVITFNGSSCQAFPAAVTVTVKPLPAVTLSNIKGNICGANSFFTSVPYNAGYTYQWYNSGGPIAGKTSSSLSANTPDTYYVVVTDATSGCSSTSSPVTVTASPLPAKPVITGPSSFCSGNSIQLTASSSGGTGTLTYSWSTGQVAQSIVVSSPGYNYAYVTDQNGCSSNNYINVTMNPIPDLSIFPVGCYTRCVSDSIFGPPGYASYRWQMNGADISASQNINATASGTYKLIVSTSLGCTDTSGNLNLTVAPLPVANAGHDTTLCTGNVQLHGSGGDIYLWNPPTYLSSVNISNPVSTPASGIDYELTVTDKNGCKDKDSVKILISCVTPTVVVTGASICQGACASVTATGSAGTPAYTYSWSSGQTGAGPQNLCPITTTIYTVTISDATGASSTNSATIIVYPGMTLNPSSNNILCNGSKGSAAVTVAGGNPSFTYSWSPTGGTADNTGNVLSAGTYSVSVTDSKGCSATTSITITNPPLLTATPTSTAANCGGTNGTVTVTINGGTGAYNYTWSTVASTASVNNLSAGTYTVTVTDANNCTASTTAIVNNTGGMTATSQVVADVSCNGASDGSISLSLSGGTAPLAYSWSAGGGTGSTASNLSAGTYSVTVTDANGCIAITSAAISEPNAITLVINTTDASCGGSNGTAKVSVTGGTGSYTYLWTNGNATDSTGALAQGNYTASVTDSKGCAITTTAQINNSNGPSVTATSTNVSCFGASDGTAKANATGGTGLYTYSWQPVSVTTNQATGLSAGIYSVTVSDGQCTSKATVTITEPAQISITPSETNAICGLANGSASVVVTGGQPGYTYSWQTSGGTGQSEINLSAGSYTVVVTDASSCSASSSVLVSNAGGPTVTTGIISNVKCNGQSNGSAFVNASAGNGAYSYSWQPSGGTASTANGLSVGSYTIIVTDANGCIANSTVAITQPLPLQAVTNVTNPLCPGNIGSADVTASGGSTVYTYNWTPTGSTLQNISGLSGGIYTVMVTDANNCTTTSTAFITIPSAFIINAVAVNAACGNTSTGAAGVSVSGGTSGYSYSWSPVGGTGQTASSLSAGTYTVFVTDANGCTGSNIVQVKMNTLPAPVFSADTTSGCESVCILFTNTAPGSVQNCSWDFGDGNINKNCLTRHCYPNVGAYTVKLSVTDSNGCSGTTTKTNYINVYPKPEALFSSDPTVTSILTPAINFTDKSSSDVTKWDWSFGDLFNATSTLKNPTYTYRDTGKYSVELIVTNAFGCKDTAIDSILIKADYTFYVPNAFSPNGDATNDTFFPKGIDINRECFKMYIFDRWGNLIYKTDDLDKGWDGRANGGKDVAQQDVYVWKIETCDLYKRKYFYVGHVTLIK